MTPGEHPVILSIAGFDPSSGAGVTADIKTIAAHGCYGVCCITAVTVQSTLGVIGVYPEPGSRVRETLEALAADMPVAALRIGMLGSGEVAEAVAQFLAGRALPVILDPIIRSSSGTSLLDEAGLKVLRERLLPLATVITPNIDEAASLTGLPVTNTAEMTVAAKALKAMGARNVVVTGGHLSPAVDVLLEEDGKVHEFSAPQIASSATHGTGCAFASALACNLALGNRMGDSVKLAKEYVIAAIAAAYGVGRGRGPINHLFGLHTGAR